MMKITINGVPYDTQISETICERFSEIVENTLIVQVQETLYLTSEGKYFSYIWRFHDFEGNDIPKEDHIEESIQTMEPEEVILWLRADALQRRYQDPPTYFSPIGNSQSSQDIILESVVF